MSLLPMPRLQKPPTRSGANPAIAGSWTKSPAVSASPSASSTASSKTASASPPQNYLIKTRIQAACDALREPGTQIADVAIDLGFCDQSAFTAQFRRHMGITPLKYQREFRGQIRLR